MPALRVLCVHGLGDHRQSPWKEEWEAAVREVFPASDDVQLDFVFHSYDHIFEDVDISTFEAIRAVGKLLKSGVASIFRGRARGAVTTRGFSQFLRWYAGYVVAWTEDEGFQRQTRRAFLKALREHEPDVVLAHSLGTLVTYNALTHAEADTPELRKIAKNVTYVTLGSQIGNAFVIGNLTHGRVQPLPVTWWYHLYNDEDDVFTAPIRLWDADNFTQVDTHFDIDGWMDHSAVHYLKHAATTAQVWSTLAHRVIGRMRGTRREQNEFVPLFAGRARAEREPRRRALLVGINEYPNDEDRLEGCVNDVFLMSEVLQESGFDAGEIRVVLDDRATAEGIVERLDWLLDDPRKDDELVFFYSGHGAQLPTYGEGDRVDEMDETLVPYDFDWSPETCVTDDTIYSLYSQLPYGTKLMMVFDCCHSGGIHRAGAPRARGLNPPDDVRHRGLRWNVKTRMWEPRDLEPINREFTADEDVERKFFGEGGYTKRIGRGGIGRKDTQRQYTAAAKRSGTRPVGPYLPLILEACREDQFAYEYRHGVTSFGAFTYSLASILRQKKRISYDRLVERAGEQLARLGYEQAPQILGPSRIRRRAVPWAG